jgi:hypothetical protein
MSSSASAGEDEPPEGERRVLSSRPTLAALTAETVGIGGALWGTKDILESMSRTQLLVYYLAIFALSAAIAFALVKLNRRTRVWGALVSGGVALSLFCTLVIITALGSRSPERDPELSARAAPTQAPAPVAPASPALAPTSTRPAPPSPRSAAPSPRSAPPSENAAASCQQRARYRVKEEGNIVDRNKTPIGRVNKGDLFVVLDEPVHVDNRRYGTVGNEGLTGYVLMAKLEPDGTVCV